MPERADVEEWVAAYQRAWVTADSSAVGALFTEDGVYRANIYEGAHVGRSAIEGYWSAVTSVQTDVDVQMGSPVIDGDRVVVEFWTRMAIDGSPVTLAGSLLLQFDDQARCTRLREYWNFADGSLQPPSGWGR